MIRVEKTVGALNALNKVLVVARHFALTERRHHEIASILDVAELLPTLFLGEQDMTEVFAGHLEDLAEQYPELDNVLAVFHEKSPP